MRPSDQARKVCWYKEHFSALLRHAAIPKTVFLLLDISAAKHSLWVFETFFVDDVCAAGGDGTPAESHSQGP